MSDINGGPGDGNPTTPPPSDPYAQWQPPVGQPVVGQPVVGATEYLTHPEDATVLPPGAPVIRKSRRTRVIAATVALALLVGGGVAVAKALAGDGAQPDDALPADVVASIRIDGDPPAGQKLAVARFAMNFEDSGVTSSDDPIGQLLEKLFSSSPGVSYAEDIKPWIDKRIAIAARIDPAHRDDLSKAYPLVVVAYKDEAALRQHLDKVVKAASSSGKPAGYAIADGFVTFSDTTEHAQASVNDAKTAPLSQSAAYKSALDTVGADSVVFGWIAYGRLHDALVAQLDKNGSGLGQTNLGGGSATSLLSGLGTGKVDADASVSVAMRAGSNYVETVVDAYKLDASSTAPTPPLGDDLTKLSAGNAVVVGVAGQDQGLMQALERLDKLLAEQGSTASASSFGPTDDPPFTVDGLLDKVGLTRTTLRLILGSRLVGSLDGSLGGALAVTTTDGSGAVDTLTSVLHHVESLTNGKFNATSALRGLHLQTTADGYAMGTTASAVDKLANPVPPYLGDDSVFKLALPDASRATFAMYANVDNLDSDLRNQFSSGPNSANLKPLQAVGFSASQDGQHTLVRLRVVVR